MPGNNDRSLGWTRKPAVSPEAVLRGVLHGLPVHVDLFPEWLKWQPFLQKCNEEVGNLARGRQNPGQLGLVVAGEAEAAGRDDGNAEAQADLIAVGRQTRVTTAEDGSGNANPAETHSTNWKVA